MKLQVKHFEQDDTDVLEQLDLGVKVVLYKDDVNTFDWVIEGLCEICEHEPIQAEQCAMLVPFKGKALVKKGEDDKMKAICQSLCDRGLSAIIE